MTEDRELDDEAVDWIGEPENPLAAFVYQDDGVKRIVFYGGSGPLVSIEEDGRMVTQGGLSVANALEEVLEAHQTIRGFSDWSPLIRCLLRYERAVEL